MRMLSVFLALVLLPAASSSQSIFLTGNVGAGRIEGQNGVTGAIGMAAALGRHIVLFADGDGLFYQQANDRYHFDTFSNGQERCRDSQTGQFARDSLCSETQAIYGAVFELDLMIPVGGASILLGGGYRLGDAHGSKPIVAAGVVVDQFDGIAGWFVRGSAGREFLQGHVGAVVRLGGSR